MALQQLGEAGSGSDEVARARGHHTLSAQFLGQRVADPLECGGVSAGCNERRNGRLPQDIKALARLAWQAPSASTVC